MHTWLRGALVLLLAVAIFAVVAVTWLWNDRPDPEALGINIASESVTAGGVTVSWLGVSTLLFDDGETRLLTDGFFSRPDLWDLALDRPVRPDPSEISEHLKEAGIERLAAVMTVHSHYDHAMDAGEVAKLTGAVVVGSSSTANAARGSGLPESRVITIEEGVPLVFGRFEVIHHPSRHAPIGADDGPPMPGTIDAPLTLPAPISAWREGGSHSIEIRHPAVRILVQGSAGFVTGALAEVEADVVFLGIGAMSGLGRDYAGEYWKEIVGRTRATRVFLIHFDDFTRPYGSIVAFPRFVDDLDLSFAWLKELATSGGAATRLERLPFRKPVSLR